MSAIKCRFLGHRYVTTKHDDGRAESTCARCDKVGWTYEPPTRIETVDLGNDPLNPHGDGSIRAGDPMWDLMMRSMETGEGLIANRRYDGQWDVKR